MSEEHRESARPSRIRPMANRHRAAQGTTRIHQRGARPPQTVAIRGGTFRSPLISESRRSVCGGIHAPAAGPDAGRALASLPWRFRGAPAEPTRPSRPRRRGKVVVQQEAFLAGAFQFVDELLVLGPVPSVARRTSAWVSPRVNSAGTWVRGQHADFGGRSTTCPSRRAPFNALAIIENAQAHDLGL